MIQTFKPIISLIPLMIALAILISITYDIGFFWGINIALDKVPYTASDYLGRTLTILPILWLPLSLGMIILTSDIPRKRSGISENGGKLALISIGILMIITGCIISGVSVIIATGAGLVLILLPFFHSLPFRDDKAWIGNLILCFFLFTAVFLAGHQVGKETFNNPKEANIVTIDQSILQIGIVTWLNSGIVGLVDKRIIVIPTNHIHAVMYK